MAEINLVNQGTRFKVGFDQESEEISIDYKRKKKEKRNTPLD